MPRRPPRQQVERTDMVPFQHEEASKTSDEMAHNLSLLRKNWKWAALSQFLYTFSPLLNMDDISLSDIEDDLIRGSRVVLPRVMTRLLFVLSSDRKVSIDTWQSALRKQYARRDPTSNPIGPDPPRHRSNSEAAEISRAESSDEAVESSSEPETKDWLDLPMNTKLDSMHCVAEWQFNNPTKLRTLMKSDDEEATWVHLIFGEFGLTIDNFQRLEPIGYDVKSNAYWLIGADRLWIQRTPPRSTNKTLKRKRAAELGSSAVKRARLDPSKQNKELESSNSRTQKSSNARALGTRVSARLRGNDDKEWQTIPTGWLSNEERHSSKQNPGLENDSDLSSELTELSEEELDDIEVGTSNDGHDFVEWETICSTLQEWETIAARFKGGTHYTEKSLHEVLTQHIVPIITEELRVSVFEFLCIPPFSDLFFIQELERKQQLENAIVHRKRSSRIAMKEQEKQTAKLIILQKSEAHQKKTRAQRLEARLATQEVERERRETAREQRKRDAAEDDGMTESDAEATSKAGGDSVAEDDTTSTRGPNHNMNGRTRTSRGDDWVLNCEICGQSGLNMDDGRPLLCCGSCFEWQHIPCHDQANMQAGRPHRNWEQVDFVCHQCSPRQINGKISQVQP
ncbi:DALR-1 domain-containing protein [Mycena indigotica]|uniref:DALR-1 domain-containing protein n=1 Tax=Mycena indigotica TaxID=2126181 RepID=A0A8H6T908_9AGAR|nr:DALR-1 domain-containing protein [Mycena indigotica]KAF7312177.1 DALR-1 domain-containing protein [Mycena indigotica]